MQKKIKLRFQCFEVRIIVRIVIITTAILGGRLVR